MVVTSVTLFVSSLHTTLSGGKLLPQLLVPAGSAPSKASRKCPTLILRHFEQTKEIDVGI